MQYPIINNNGEDYEKDIVYTELWRQYKNADYLTNILI